MKKRSTLLKVAAMAAGFAWSLSAIAAEAPQVTTLRFATITAESSRAYKAIMKPLALAIEKDSAGRIKVDLRGGANGFGKPAALLDMVKRDDIDIAYTVQGYTPGRFPRTTMVELPLMFRDAQEGTRVLWGLYKDGLIAKDYAGLKVLSLNTSVPFSIFSATKPITAIKDLRGMRIRVASPTSGLSLARMGAVPIGLPVNLIGESIANGLVDAISFTADALDGLPGVNDKPVSDQIKAVYNCGFAELALMVVMNQKSYDNLPPDMQKVIDSHFGAALGQAMAKDRDTSEAEAQQRMKNNPRYTYTAITAEQHVEMVKLISPVVDDWKKSLAAQGIDADKLLKGTQDLKDQKAASAE
jgi:TRAP-type transport system periplasmic protein